MRAKARGRRRCGTGKGSPRTSSDSSPGPPFYYDAWYHVAFVLSKQKETVKARQTLQGVMRLNPSVGGSEMKAKYQGLVARLSKK